MRIDGLTDEEKRVLIAEFCGWVFQWSNEGGRRVEIMRPDGKWFGPYFVQKLCPALTELLPNYLFSLNDILEAEKTLTGEQHARFRDALWLCIPSPARVRDFHSPEARWKADALLLTLPESLNAERTGG